MNSNGLLQKHWLQVSLHFLLDVAFVIASCVVAAYVIFEEEAAATVRTHWLSFAITGSAFGSAAYIAGLYTSHGMNRSGYRRFFFLGCCVLFSAILLIGLTYASTARPLGRGYMLVAMGIHALLALTHHGYLLYALKTARERVAYIVTNSFDEGETHIFTEIGLNHLDFIGVIAALGYQPTGKLPLLGRADDMAEIVRRERIDRILVTGKAMNHATLCKEFCQLRYSGVTVMPLVILCEEVDQYVPLELVSPEWLLNASGEPHLLYIRKIKRLFDVVVSAVGLVLALPVLLLATLAVKLTSRGPVIFRQIRSGRFGKTFSMIKLRTMRVDAEKSGVQWAQGGANGSRDPRVTFVGGIMRRFRVDEIPQLWNVLKGEMSFVGPRPERPEMIADLAKSIPFYEERMMVQPGITGWAQVNYPYGASVLDARHKLEYDLYYLKNMGLFLDVFILLDTVRTVLFGGARSRLRRVEVSGPKLEELKEKERKVEPVLGTA
jgi:exopolysaccharide biosynthesis polyprenyl glycosylphosphotransferase